MPKRTIKRAPKSRKPKPKLPTWQQKAKKWAKKYKHEIRYAILIGGYALVWHFFPGAVISIQDSALSGIENTAGFLGALYTKLDKLLYAVLGIGGLWTLWKHGKDIKEKK